MDLILNVEPKQKYKQPTTDKNWLKQIWLSLLDLDAFDGHQLNSQNKDEFGFSMLLQAISFKFKSK